MRVLHTSDLHGDYDFLIYLLTRNRYDLWIDTGDLHNDPFYPPRRPESGKKQLEDFLAVLPEVQGVLAGRPRISVPGNHDFVEINEVLETNEKDFPWIQCIRGVRPIRGHWNYETDEETLFTRMCYAIENLEIVNAPFKIICMHTPPHQILDERMHFGSIGFRNAIDLHKDRLPPLFLFGHTHFDNGTLPLHSALFVNSATNGRIIDFDTEINYIDESR